MTGPEIAPASPGQRTLWLASRHRGGSGLMSVPILLRMTGSLDVAALQAALDAVLANHESLRTTVEMRQRRLVQVIRPAGEVRVPIEGPGTEALPAEKVTTLVREMLRTEPDPATVPLRAGLWRTGPREHVFALNLHHLVTDGWSNRLIRSELGTSYTALLAGQPVRLVPEQTRYASFASAAAGPAPAAAGRDYWATTLRGASFARLPGPGRDRPGLTVRTGQARPPARHQPAELDPDTVDRLRQVGRQRRTTLFVLLLSGFMHALGALTDQDDLAVGSIFANRTDPRLHRTVGMFATLAVLRSRVAGDPLACADRLRRPVLTALGHQELHHGILPLGTGEEVRHGSPGDAVFHLLTRPPAIGEERFSDLEVTELTWPDGLASRFDLELVLSLSSDDGGMAGLFRYADDRLDDAWIGQLRDRFTAAVAVMTR
jgi:hypothetical protein